MYINDFNEIFVRCKGVGSRILLIQFEKEENVC